MTHKANALEIPPEERCKNNDWVRCLHKDRCNKCGWDPVVSEQRTQKHNETRNQIK